MQKKYILSLFILLLSLIILPPFVFAQTATLTPTSSSSSQSEQDVRNKIKELEQKVADLKSEEKTLTSEISVMDNQIKLTEYRIASTKSEIEQTENNIVITKKKISKLEGSLENVSKVLLNRIVAYYKVGSSQPLALFSTATNATDYLNKEDYLKAAQEHDKQMMIDMQQAKDSYSNQKDIFENTQIKLESLNKQLESYSDELDAEKDKKKTLLSQTQGSEANYKKLLAAAKAQLAGFSNFTANQGGASLLSGQTKCDDWGCYYSQRDTQWGGMSLNGTQYTLASDGCLVTSMAMVLTHYGHKITPVDINADSDNFASYYPAYLLYTIHVDGVTAQRVGTTIDAALSNGDPVVVGVHAYGGTHFVVLKSGSGGNYTMHDPYLANGNDLDFTDHYSVGSIFEINKVVIQ
jgi:peptidoglycan hydrolase CwlO-like protein